MTASEVFVGLSLILALAVAAQVVAARVGVPAIIVLLPVGFLAGALVPSVNPDKLFGVAFEPLRHRLTRLHRELRVEHGDAHDVVARRLGNDVERLEDRHSGTHERRERP